MTNLLFINKNGYGFTQIRKNRLFVHLRHFILLSILFVFAVFLPGCGNGFKTLLDDPTAFVAVTGVNLNKTATTINVSGTVQLTPTITPSNATIQNVSWSSDTTGVAAVDSNGLVTGGTTAGNATITVTTSDGGYTATCAVTVSTTTVAVTGVSLDKTSSSINVGGTVQLNPTIVPSDATNQNVTWSSNATGVATVSSSGLVTGVAAGNATITVTTTDGDYTAACTVTVTTATVAVTGISLDKTTSTITVGGTVQLNPTISPSNATNQNVTWSTNKSTVATVSSSGVVSGVATGSATITVTTTDGAYTAACTVTVTTASVAVTGVSLDKTSSSIYVGETLQLTPTISPSNATNQNVTWSSSSTGIATVSSSGLVTGAALGGPATITVTTADGSHTASCSITVANAIFWTETDGTINKKYTNGTGEKIILTCSTGVPLDIALHISGGKIYWTEYSSSSGVFRIKRAGTDGTCIENFSSEYSSSTYFGPTAIAIDSQTGKIYWNQFQYSNAILYSSLNSFAATTVKNGISPNYTHSLCLDTVNSNFYITNDSYWNLNFSIGSTNSGVACYGSYNGSSFYSPINLTGLTTTSMALRGIAADGTGGHVYYVGNNGTYLCILKSADMTINPSTPTVLVNSGGSFGMQKITLDLTSRKIYWISDTNNSIYRADLDTANSNIEQFLTAGSTPTGIAITQ